MVGEAAQTSSTLRNATERVELPRTEPLLRIELSEGGRVGKTDSLSEGERWQIRALRDGEDSLIWKMRGGRTQEQRYCFSGQTLSP